MLQFADKQAQTSWLKEAAMAREAALGNAALMQNQCAQAIPEREIPREIGQLDHEIELLNRVVAEHAERIAPVVSDAPADLGGKLNAPVVTGLGGRLSEFSNRVRAIRERLEWLTANCQI